ncbi:MAG: hypothetical protein LKE48_07350 [Solobacterium sp.]|jgi:hypothetical protein|nr:hypothetical protein [Solobacterium sp.]
MIVVTNKLTYLLLLTVPVGFLKIFFFDVTPTGINYHEIFVSIMIMLCGMYLFIRVNTYSPFFNPDHPKHR